MGLDQLRGRLYVLAFVDEFGPLYALFTLWFNDNDITTGQLSVVFVLWVALAIVLEIPSGALADRVDRRALLASAFALRAVGIAIWMISPTFGGLIAGAVLWALHDALASGAWEAMIHDQLEAVGHESAYAPVMARLGQFSNVGLAAGTVIAAGLTRFGASIEAIGWTNVAIHAGSIGLVLLLPDVRWVAAQDSPPRDGTHAPSATAEWWATLRSGVSTARSRPHVARLIVVGALLEGLFIVDEYVPLMARLRGASNTVVPMIVMLVWVGLIVGGELAARRPDLSGRRLAVLLIGGSVAMIVAVVTDPVWTLALVGVGYGTLEAARVISDARFQAQLPRATRATVTSVRSFNAGIVGVGAFATIGILATGDDPSTGVVIGIGVLIVAGLLVGRWLPDAAATPEPSITASESP